MSSIAELPPTELHSFADMAEDEAYSHPQGPRRTRMLGIAYKMRATANLAVWLGDELKVEVVKETPGTKAW